jgi:hypothetical protein
MQENRFRNQGFVVVSHTCNEQNSHRISVRIISAKARAEGLEMNQIVNAMLKKDIATLERSK